MTTDLPIVPAPHYWSATHNCPHCNKPLLVEPEGADGFKLFCPHGSCNSVACNAGNPNPEPTEALAFASLENAYNTELTAGAEV